MKDPTQLCMYCMGELTEAASICPHCGRDISACENEMHQLPCGSILAGCYLVGCVLGQGGFGVTYIGWDLNLDAKIAIKEYYPDGFVRRDQGTQSTVHPLAGERGEFFTRGRAKFVEEAKTLARFSGDPAVVNVRNFFFENGTAYLVMDYVEGETLKDYAKRRGGKLPAKEVLDLVSPLIDTLGRVHTAGLLHRDISPDNIILQPDGSIKLLDFGAARQMSALGEKSLTINVKHGFALEEQYRTHGEQGPWSDVYALSATIYFLTTGRLPPPAMDRFAGDAQLPSPNTLGAGLTSVQEAALLHGLAVRKDERTADMETLKRELYGGHFAKEAAVAPQEPGPEATVAKDAKPPEAKHTRGKRVALIAAAAVALLALGAGLAVFLSRGRPTAQTATVAATASPAASSPSPTRDPTPSPSPSPSPTPAYIAVPARFRPPRLSAGAHFTVAVLEDGTVITAGNNEYGQCDVSGWTDITAVSACALHTVGLRSDGTVVAAGDNEYGQCGVSGWTDIVAVSAGFYHTVGLKSDGTVVAAGNNECGQCDVSDWKNIVAVAAGVAHTVGLKSDGTAVAVGQNDEGQCNVSGWTDVVAVSALFYNTAGLRSDGTVVAAGNNIGGQCNVSRWTDIVAVAVGGIHVVGLMSDGTVIVAGGNTDGQCNVSGWALW